MVKKILSFLVCILFLANITCISGLNESNNLADNILILDLVDIIEVSENNDIVWEMDTSFLKIPYDVEKIGEDHIIISDGSIDGFSRMYEIDHDMNIFWVYDNEDHCISDIEIFNNGSIAFLDVDWYYTEINILDYNHNLTYSFILIDNRRLSDFEILPNGNILAIDSYSNSIIEWSTSSNRVVWEYKDNLNDPKAIDLTSDGNILIADLVSSEEPFESKMIKIDFNNNILLELSGFEIISDVEALENGNILLAENENYSFGKRVIEIDTNGNILWEYLCDEMYFIRDVERESVHINSDNFPPNKPAKPTGKINGKYNEEYTYTTNTNDIDEDNIWFKWDFGDGNFSNWIGKYNSGETCEVAYSWEEKGVYNIRVIAQDEHGAVSEWSEPLSISMPKNKPLFINNLIEHLMERFPILYQILQRILQL